MCIQKRLVVIYIDLYYRVQNVDVLQAIFQPTAVYGWTFKFCLIRQNYCIFLMGEPLTVCNDVTVSNKQLTNFKYLF